MSNLRKPQTIAQPDEVQPNTPAIDAAALMERIRARVQEDCGGRKPKMPHFAHPASQLFEPAGTPILYSEELNYLNAHWNTWTETQPFSSHRPLVGGLIVRVKNKIRDFLWNGLFRSYFDAEREFQMQLVRHLNAAARYVDARDAELFWQLVRKLDNDLQAVNERLDHLFEAASSACSALSTAHGERLEATERLCHELSRETEELSRDLARQQRKLQASAAAKSSLESSTQGQAPSSAERAQRLAALAGHFRGAPGLVLDLSGGEEALLLALKHLGERCLAFTSEPERAESLASKGIAVETEEPLAYLCRSAPSTLGGVFLGSAARLPAEPEELIRAAAGKLAPGGVVVVDTGEPEGIMHAKAFYPPLREFCTRLSAAGLTVAEANAQSHRAYFPPLAIEDYLPPKWREVFEHLNSISARLNSLIGANNYYVVFRKEQRDERRAAE